MADFETIADFSKRTNLPRRLIDALIKQGVLPHINSGRHAHIHIEGAQEALKMYSAQSAEEIAATMPVPIRLMTVKSKTNTERKYKGRPPDKIRLAKKNA